MAENTDLYALQAESRRRIGKELSPELAAAFIRRSVLPHSMPRKPSSSNAPARLSKAYDFKAVADYDTGPIAEVSSQEAVNAVEAARKFVATVRHVLTPQP